MSVGRMDRTRSTVGTAKRNASCSTAKASHLRISGRVKLWRIAMSSSLRTLTVSGTRFSRLTIESVTICQAALPL